MLDEAKFACSQPDDLATDASRGLRKVRAGSLVRDAVCAVHAESVRNPQSAVKPFSICQRRKYCI